MKLTIAIIILLFFGSAQGADAVDTLLQQYQDQANRPFSWQAGQQLWLSIHIFKDGEAGRSCTDCHGADLTQPGKHRRTGKPIAPLAPAVNPERLADAKNIEKWFKRNCQWTLGRECTPQEKGDLILFIQGNH